MMRRPQSYTEDEAAASHHERANRSWKLLSERVVLMVLVALLAAALFVIYRLSVLNSQVKTLQTLKEENEALRKNLSAQTTCPPPPSDPLASACPPSWGNMNERRLKCEADWEHHGGKCYYFTTTNSSWEESRDGCRGKGGDLVKIDSREEQIFLEARLRDKMEKPEDKFWIGLTDSEEEGRWLWADGSSLETCLSFWHEGEPVEPDDWTEENPAGEDCVRMGKQGGAADMKCWFDRDCNATQKSICEKAAETRWIGLIG